ncbi:hypothetical protein OSB04_020083 [Centaurea solstitialis]|uniref:Reverse transcriptase Ty1/copia-type domain-containing protein n=1 Tax=Centaurea solstitialis TaxID=347529 RepID=A0AA38T3Q7_9ASTR|nr:hypothetical protein OSB04_020083 [Centaurea solstitialis]
MDKGSPIDLIIGDPTSSVQTRLQQQIDVTILVFLNFDWITAMKEELNQFEALKVVALVKLPTFKSLLIPKWLFKNREMRHGLWQRLSSMVGIDSTKPLLLLLDLKLFACFWHMLHIKTFTVFQMDAQRAWYESCLNIVSKGFKKGSLNSIFLMKEGEHIVVIQIMLTILFLDYIGVIINFFLGLQVRQFSDGIFINQSKYIFDLLKKYDMSGCHSIGTPMATGNSIDPDHEGKDVDLRNYRSMVGSLMYLTASRPDIMFATCVCARYHAKPKESHLAAGTPYYGIWYPKGLGFELQAYTDADYGGCNMDRKSTSGHLQFLGNKLVSWASKKQQCVSTSTAESEYVAATSCCSQVLWMQSQLRDYGLEYKKIPIYCDSKKNIELYFVNTEYQLADLFTKALDEKRFKFLISRLGGAYLVQVSTVAVVLPFTDILSVQSTPHNPNVDVDRQLIRPSLFFHRSRTTFHSTPCKDGAPVIHCNFTKSSLYTVLTKMAEVPLIYVQQVWNTLQFHADPDNHHFTAKLDHYTISFGVNKFRLAMAGVESVGHLEAINAPSQFNKSKLPPTYNTLFTILSRCLTGKRTAQDTATQSFLILFYGVLFNKHYDYASLIFYDLKELLAKRQKHLPFPRFLSILIASAMERNPDIPRRSDAERSRFMICSLFDI